MSTRRQAREMALQMLYQSDVGGAEGEQQQGAAAAGGKRGAGQNAGPPEQGRRVDPVICVLGSAGPACLGFRSTFAV